jgi:hypothetical protein
MERITKLGLAQQLLSELFPNPTNDKKVSERMAMLYIDQARDFICAREINSNRIVEKNIDGSWLSKFDAVVYEDDCDLYIDLKKRPIRVFTEQGVYRVWVKGQEDDLLTPLRAGASWLYSDDLEETYELEGDRLKIRGLSKGVKLVVQLLAQGEDISATEYYPIDSSFKMEIIEMAAQRLMKVKQIPQDKLNNNISE